MQRRTSWEERRNLRGFHLSSSCLSLLTSLSEAASVPRISQMALSAFHIWQTKARWLTRPKLLGPVSVVHEPGCSLTSPGESFEQRMLPTLHPRAIGSASVGQRLPCWLGLMAPQVIAIYCQGWGLPEWWKSGEGPATEAKRSKLSSKESEKRYLVFYILEIFWSKANQDPWLSIIKLYMSLNNLVDESPVRKRSALASLS